AVAAAMERLGADIDIDLDASCSECGHRHSVRFQIQDYLLGAISADWGGLLEDLHQLAPGAGGVARRRSDPAIPGGVMSRFLRRVLGRTIGQPSSGLRAAPPRRW